MSSANRATFFINLCKTHWPHNAQKKLMLCATQNLIKEKEHSCDVSNVCKSLELLVGLSVFHIVPPCFSLARHWNKVKKYYFIAIIIYTISIPSLLIITPTTARHCIAQYWGLIVWISQWYGQENIPKAVILCSRPF